MKLPNADAAVIDRGKIVDYLLDIDHPHGGSKARLLMALGYSASEWQRLDDDLRSTHLLEDIVSTVPTIWGTRYEIVAPMTGPSGDSVFIPQRVAN